MLNLLPLETRRDHTSIIFLHKLLHNKVDSRDIMEMLSFRVPQKNTRLNMPFIIKQTNRNYCYNSPILHSMRNCNMICNEIDLYNVSLTTLKNKLRAS